MKNLVLTAITTTTILFAVSSLRADSSNDSYPVTPDSAKPRNAVAELRNQDSAFALLTESFRQIQIRLIQNDYEARIHAGSSLDDLKARRQVVVLAKQERDLRLQKLLTQLGNMRTGYDYARRADEREASVIVPSNVDTVEAANRLKGFVVVTPDALQRAGNSRAAATPASNFLLSEPSAD